MSTVNEVIQLLKSLEDDLNAYIYYDGQVGGLVSRSIKSLTEARGMLNEPTKLNAQETLKRVEGVRDEISPYAGYVPGFWTKINSVIEKLQTF